MVNLRKQLVVDKALQYSIVRYIVFYGLGLSTIFLSLLYIVSGRFIDELARAGVDQQIMIRFYDGINQLTILFFAVILLITFITAYFSLYFSNKIAGPIFNIEKVLDAHEANEQHVEIKLRKNDYFLTLATKVNRLIIKNQKNW